MTITQINTDGYNKFTLFPLVSSEIIQFLLEHEELIFKLLFYNDADAYKNDPAHPNLTISQKRALIYKGSGDQSDYRIFMGIGMDSAFTSQATILRITPSRVVPVERTIGNMTVTLEIYSHSQIDTLSNLEQRSNMIAQRLIELLNGQTVGQLGPLWFSRGSKYNNDSEMIIGASLPFKAVIIKMCNWVT